MLEFEEAQPSVLEYPRKRVRDNLARDAAFYARLEALERDAAEFGGISGGGVGGGGGGDGDCDDEGACCGDGDGDACGGDNGVWTHQAEEHRGYATGGVGAAEVATSTLQEVENMRTESFKAVSARDKSLEAATAAVCCDVCTSVCTA